MSSPTSGMGTFLCEGPESESLQLCGPAVSVITTQLDCPSTEAAGSPWGRSGPGRVPIKLYLQIQAAAHGTQFADRWYAVWLVLFASCSRTPSLARGEKYINHVIFELPPSHADC